MSDRTDSGQQISPPLCNEPYLLTPGPLSTAATVKQAMLRDWGSWDGDFRQMTRSLRTSLLAMIDDPDDNYECVPMQGSGTFVVEAMLGTLLPENSHTLVLMNGAYGKRIATTLNRIGRQYSTIDMGDYLPPLASDVAQQLEQNPGISHVVVVHCETSSGILNPIEAIADVVAAAGRKLLIDSMSAFGAIPISARKVAFTALVSSANKCIEGTPGFGFAIIRKSDLLEAKGNCHSLSLDLHDQWQQMESNGQWRFTPPTHVIAAFIEALKLHALEGGVSGRLARYTANRDTLVAGMQKLGFKTLLQGQWLSPIIVTFLNPADPNFHFEKFYELMKQRGFIIYPGKLTEVDSFRIGCIGQLNSSTMTAVVAAASECLIELGVHSALPVKSVSKESMV